MLQNMIKYDWQCMHPKSQLKSIYVFPSSDHRCTI